MGTDIHAHLEVKKNGEWHHWCKLNKLQRNYELFCRIAGVREDICESEPIAKGRGFPDDASFLTKLEAEYMLGDAHSFTYLSRTETILVFQEQERRIEFFTLRQAEYVNAGFLATFDDARLVCWFDS
jgi:hypothetical protein